MNFRKLAAGLVAGAMLTGAMSSFASAADSGLILNGKAFDSGLYIAGGRIYAPLRAVSEKLGYTVSWDNNTKTAIVTQGDERDSFKIGDGSVIIGGKTYTHVRKLAEAMNGDADWNNASKTATLWLKDCTVPGTVKTPDETSSTKKAKFDPSADTRSGRTQIPDLTGIYDENADYSEEDFYWLARIIHAEAQGEPMEGKIAVANTILERVANENYPDNIYDVVFDTKWTVQYEPVLNGHIYNDPGEDSYEAARRALEGENIVPGSMFFFNPDKATSTWISDNREYLTRIGNHVFYI